MNPTEANEMPKKCPHCGHHTFLPNADHVPTGVVVCDRCGEQVPKQVKSVRQKVD